MIEGSGVKFNYNLDQLKSSGEIVRIIKNVVMWIVHKFMEWLQGLWVVVS